jgi:hypothetical protein
MPAWLYNNGHNRPTHTLRHSNTEPTPCDAAYPSFGATAHSAEAETRGEIAMISGKRYLSDKITTLYKPHTTILTRKP